MGIDHVAGLSTGLGLILIADQRFQQFELGILLVDPPAHGLDPGILVWRRGRAGDDHHLPLAADRLAQQVDQRGSDRFDRRLVDECLAL